MWVPLGSWETLAGLTSSVFLGRASEGLAPIATMRAFRVSRSSDILQRVDIKTAPLNRRRPAAAPPRPCQLQPSDHPDCPTSLLSILRGQLHAPKAAKHFIGVGPEFPKYFRDIAQIFPIFWHKFGVFWAWSIQAPPAVAQATSTSE